jgi:hypothetical protein
LRKTKLFEGIKKGVHCSNDNYIPAITIGNIFVCKSPMNLVMMNTSRAMNKSICHKTESLAQ